VAAFGPPGSSGELNVSVIVSPVPQDLPFAVSGLLTSLFEFHISNLLTKLDVLFRACLKNLQGMLTVNSFFGRSNYQSAVWCGTV
jgi:hypothetical protein